MKKFILFAGLMQISLFATAEQQTVVLDVPTMNCITCPITVKKSLQNVEGVSEAEVVFDTKLATVTFDDQKTNVKALMEATTNAGYPSVLKKKDNHE